MSLPPFIFMILAFAILNGLFSPLLLQVVAAMIVLAPGFFAPSPPILFFSASLMLSTLTVMVAGVPAALYERATGATQPTPVSMWIWLAGAAILTLPAIGLFLDVGF